MESVLINQITPEELANLVDDAVAKALKNWELEKRNNIWLSLTELSEYLPFSRRTGKNYAISSIYQLTSTKSIPFSKIGRHLYFSKTDIDKWLESGRRETREEEFQRMDRALSERYLNKKHPVKAKAKLPTKS